MKPIITIQDIDRVYEMLVKEDRIPAIKEWRRLTNCHLKEAKDFVVGDTYHKPPAQFRIDAMTHFITSPAELIAEFATHVRRLEQIIAQFAELADQWTDPREGQ